METSLDTDLLIAEGFFKKSPSLSDAQLLDFILAWHERGETSAELLSFVDYVFAQKARMETGFEVYDCAGTGGDKANTFNISTTAAIIAAGAGLRISKNGGRKTTSKAGSVDVLEALGFNLEASPERRLQGLKEHNLAFLASKITGDLLLRVKNLCRQAQTSSFISLLGPLTNPIKLKGQIIGLGQKRWLEPVKGVLETLISRAELNRACLLRSTNIRLDELSTATEAQLEFLFHSASGVKSRLFSFRPEDIGLRRSSISELGGRDPVHNAELIRSILDFLPSQSKKAVLEAEGEPSASTNDSMASKLETACLNAALLLLLDGDLDALLTEEDFRGQLRHHYMRAYEAVVSGKVWANFTALLNLLKT